MNRSPLRVPLRNLRALACHVYKEHVENLSTNISRPCERKKSHIVSDILDYGLQYGVSIILR